MLERILVLDDLPEPRSRLESSLREIGSQTPAPGLTLPASRFEIRSASTVDDALVFLAKAPADLIFLRFRSAPDTAEVIEQLQTRPAPLHIVLLTEEGGFEEALGCIGEPVAGILLEPWSHLNLHACLATMRQFALVRAQTRELARQGNVEFIGVSAPVEELRDRARRIANTDAAILIQGELGSGKATLARLIHQLSPRRAAPLFELSCQGPSPEELEAILFGGDIVAEGRLVGRCAGLLKAGSGGTLLLRHVGSLPLTAQGRLLQFMNKSPAEEKGCAAGGRNTIRILATSSHDLEALAQNGQFRDDLALRLKLGHLAIPPLAERPGDIPALTAHLVKKLSRRMRKFVNSIAPAVLAEFERYSWPGNVSELETLLHRGILLCPPGQAIELAHLNFGTAQASLADRVLLTMDQMERKHIFDVLEACDGNRTHAADKLGVSIRTLRNKLRQFREQKLP